MNEIEKLYENANVKPYIYCSKPRLDCNARETGNCKQDCEYYSGKRLLTPFTAEKQIELIKLLAIRFSSDYMSYWRNEIKDVWIFRLHDLTKFSSKEPCIYEGRNKDFTEALCNLINDLWQDLTEEEKEQIRSVLNG